MNLFIVFQNKRYSDTCTFLTICTGKCYKKTLSFRLKEHVEDKNKLPILIFPEGRWTYVAHVM